jgi:O-antigen/teichoic acid export membrane protein
MPTDKAVPELNLSPGSLWQRVRASRLVQDVWKLFALQIAGRVVAFFASTYAMRSLGPEQLGVGAFIVSIVVEGAVLGDLGLNISGIRALGDHPDKRNETVSLVWGIRLRAALVLSVFVVAVAWAFRPVGSMGLWLLGAPLFVFTILSPQWIFQGIERLPVLNTIQLAQMATSALLYFGLFRPGARAELYVLVAALTEALAWGLSYYVLRRHVHMDWLGFDWRRAWEIIRTSGYAYGIVLTIFLYAGLEIPLITLLRSPEDAGVYRAAQGIAGTFLRVLSVLWLLLYPRLIAWKNRSDHEFRKRATTTMLLLSGLALLFDVTAFAVVPIAFDVLLGVEFQAGVWPCILICVGIGFILIGAVPTWGLLAYGLDKRQLAVTLTAAVVSVTLNVLLIPRFGIVATAGVKVVTEVIILILSLFFLFRFLRSRRNSMTTQEFE